MDTLLARPARGQEEEDEGEEEGEGWNRNMQMSSHTSNGGGMNEVAARRRRGQIQRTHADFLSSQDTQEGQEVRRLWTRADPVQPREANKQAWRNKERKEPKHVTGRWEDEGMDGRMKGRVCIS